MPINTILFKQICDVRIAHHEEKTSNDQSSAAPRTGGSRAYGSRVSLLHTQGDRLVNVIHVFGIS